MQVFIILLVMGLLIGTQWPQTPVDWSRDWLVLMLVGPYMGAAIALQLVCSWSYRALERSSGRSGRILTRTYRLLDAIRWLTLVYYFFSLLELGLLTWLIGAVGWQLPGQLLFMLPPVMVIVAGWWAYYPIDRRLRESALIRRIDEGQTVWPIWTRRQFIFSQVRHQLLLLLAPLVLLLGWWQAVTWLMETGRIDSGLEQWLLGAGAICILLLSPLLIRHIWDTRPLPDGPMRDTLIALCKAQGVQVRQLLLWHTYGGMINGAVMGVVGPLRYILLTDGLLDQMKADHIEAVMAHELGHVKKKHMPGLFLCALGTLAAISLVVEVALFALAAVFEQIGWTLPQPPQTLSAADASGGAVLAIAMGVAVLLWAAAFGYISRRFERQADTFAVQHLSAGSEQITESAAQTMIGALEQVATLNHVPVGRKSWRHGSIRWRCNYLRSLIGLPVDRCPIDRQMRCLWWVCGVMLAGALLGEWLLFRMAG